MKKIILTFLCIAFIANVFAQESITNKDIIMMKTSKMSDDIVITKIKSSTCDFDLSTSGILELKNAKITDRVVKEMLIASPPEEAMTNDDVIGMFQAKVTPPLIMAKIDVTKHDFDVSPEGLIKLTSAKIPKSIVKKMMEAPTGGNTSDNARSARTTNRTSERVLKYEDVKNASAWKSYDVYIAKDGSVYKKGDKITLNFPTKNGRTFQYIFQGSKHDKKYLDASYSNKEFEILYVSVTKQDLLFGEKGTNYVELGLKSGSILNSHFRVEIENAIASGEVGSKVISEKEALEAIKTAKEKYDLKLITEDEYKKVREEMKKYIK